METPEREKAGSKSASHDGKGMSDKFDGSRSCSFEGDSLRFFAEDVVKGELPQGSSGRTGFGNREECFFKVPAPTNSSVGME